ncbi:MAG: hypothetical protein ACAI38_10820 [Myxococcota bacterium]
MGREARCRVRFGGTNQVVDVYLESTHLELRTDPPRKLPLAGMKIASIEGGWLTLATSTGPMALELGDQAAKWGRSIANPKTRMDKLGITKGARVCLVGFEDPAFEEELGTRGTSVTRKPKGQETIMFFTAYTPRDLGHLAELREQLHDDGALWLIREKGKDTLVTEAASREAAIAAGLVDVKVVSFDETRSAEKYVIPLAQRTPKPSR